MNQTVFSPIYLSQARLVNGQISDSVLKLRWDEAAFYQPAANVMYFQAHYGNQPREAFNAPTGTLETPVYFVGKVYNREDGLYHLHCCQQISAMRMVEEASAYRAESKAPLRVGIMENGRAFMTYFNDVAQVSSDTPVDFIATLCPPVESALEMLPRMSALAIA